MTTATIIDTINNETVCEELEAWGVTDALVNYFCDNSTPAEVYDACIECGNAVANGEPTDAYEAFLGIEVK